MNGSLQDVIPKIQLANPIVQLLESLLVEARAGNISSFAFVAAADSVGSHFHAHIKGKHDHTRVEDE